MRKRCRLQSLLESAGIPGIDYQDYRLLTAADSRQQSESVLLIFMIEETE